MRGFSNTTSMVISLAVEPFILGARQFEGAIRSCSKSERGMLSPLVRATWRSVADWLTVDFPRAGDDSVVAHAGVVGLMAVMFWSWSTKKGQLG